MCTCVHVYMCTCVHVEAYLGQGFTHAMVVSDYLHAHMHQNSTYMYKHIMHNELLQ